MTGSIETICGPMFSGKTEEIIKRVRRATIAKQTIKIFKPEKDDRYGGGSAIWSHDGKNIGATIVSSSAEIEVAIQNYSAVYEGELPDVVVIEEVQFFDDGIVQIVYELKCMGIRVIVAGLDIDWKGVPFTITGTLMALADKVDKQTAVCVVCHKDATYSYLKNKAGEQIQVGEENLYEARCFQHWSENE